ncbi:MAG: hypothetical protein PHH54_07065 [Candidatus Nanoarchaeia archaeon]|nr:hypothetical protein [Candidatus Nanoarchaeia archaeon]MDD5741715.1 hypothetical protein [Candidatus Nanoarchaeia archaeon]
MKNPIMMDGLDNENMCMNYLKSLGIKVEGNYRFTGHKHLIKIEGVDSFHQIAQSANISEIRNFRGGLDFILDVPNTQDKFRVPEHWTVVLSNEQTKDFLDKYGGQYKIE